VLGDARVDQEPDHPRGASRGELPVRGVDGASDRHRVGVSLDHHRVARLRAQEPGHLGRGLPQLQVGDLAPVDVDDDQFDQWYIDVIKKSGMMDNSPVAGCRVFKPYGYGLWENMQRRLDDRFKETGVENAYFPLLIPESMLAKEAEHIEGFAPELFTVTHAGGKALEEPLILRPTSETIIGVLLANCTRANPDLPLLLHQRANVLSLAPRPRVFLLRTESLVLDGDTT